MWIQIRTIDGKRSSQLDGLSKLTKIEDLRVLIDKEFQINPESQRLFFSGKQLEDGHTLFDYGVTLNSLVQVMERQKPPMDQAFIARNEVNKSSKERDNTSKDEVNISAVDCDENTPSHNNGEEIEGIYKINELVDARDKESGVWSEGIIVKVTKTVPRKDGSPVYHCIYEGYDENEIYHFTDNDLRPRSRTIIPWEKVQKGDNVMVNYNPDEPKERGDWFDCTVTRKTTKRNRNELFGILSFGEEHSEIKEECKVILTDEIYKTEKYGEVEPLMKGAEVPKRKGRHECTKCHDDETKPCKECGCSICFLKNDPGNLILCDECDIGYHIKCLKPPLESIPDEEWYCPKCKNDTSQVIKPGEKLAVSKRKMKMASANSSSNRDWGKGMACAGRSKTCTIVPENHFGPIPGVEVGTCWRFQIMAGEAGVHRNHVGGISGRANEGAFSILVSGGYEDDIDNGDEVLYTGSGGRDLSGNKRTAGQSCDQKLERFNRALAVNCAAPLDEKNGAIAVDWRAGKPTRLVRSFKLKKHHPKYAPEEGYRYDGIYKVVKYWPQKGQSGFLVWRYMLRRDDKVPPPWTKEGKKRIEELGIKIQYPEGYLEAEGRKQEEKKKEKEAKRLAKQNNNNDDTPNRKKNQLLVSFSKKRKQDSDKQHNKSNTFNDKLDTQRSPKKQKFDKPFSLSEDVLSGIKKDLRNTKLWTQVTENLDTYQTFLTRVQDSFQCVCCQELVFKPVTTECEHNTCQTCLKRSFKAEVFSCPWCRFMLGEKYKMPVNTHLDRLLQKLFPGYTANR